MQLCTQETARRGVAAVGPAAESAGAARRGRRQAGRWVHWSSEAHVAEATREARFWRRRSDAVAAELEAVPAARPSSETAAALGARVAATAVEAAVAEVRPPPLAAAVRRCAGLAAATLPLVPIFPGFEECEEAEEAASAVPPFPTISGGGGGSGDGEAERYATELALAAPTSVPQSESDGAAELEELDEHNNVLFRLIDDGVLEATEAAAREGMAPTALAIVAF